MIGKTRSQALWALVLALVLVGCRDSAEPSTTSLLFTESTVQRADMAEIVQAFGQVSALQDRSVAFEAVSGRLLQVYVQVGQEVREGDPLAQLDTAELERQLLEAGADLAVAEAVLREAQADASPAAVLQAEADLLAAQYDLAKAEMDLRLAGTLVIRQLGQQVADRGYDLQVAQDRLALTDLTSHAAQIRQLEYDQAFFQRALRGLAPDRDRVQVEESLSEAERALSAARAARESALRAARDVVRRAEDELQKAGAQLERARSQSYDPLAQARLAYEQATTRLEKTTDRLAQVREGPDLTLLDAAQTGYDAALAKLQGVEADIEASTLGAPFDGVVFDVLARSGDLIARGDPIVYLVSPDALRIEAAVSEVDVVRIQVGQPVRIRFETYPDRMLGGEVLEISPRGEAQGGLIVFRVKVSLERAELDVRPGMTASLKMVIGDQRNVLAVPAAALRQSQTGGPIVQVRTPSGAWEDRSVRIGTNDGLHAEVLSGVQEGETIRYPLQEPSQQSPYGMRGREPTPILPDSQQIVPSSEGMPLEEGASEPVPEDSGREWRLPDDGRGDVQPPPEQGQPGAVGTPATGTASTDGVRGK